MVIAVHRIYRAAGVNSVGRSPRRGREWIIKICSHREQENRLSPWGVEAGLMALPRLSCQTGAYGTGQLPRRQTRDLLAKGDRVRGPSYKATINIDICAPPDP
jgi:hypothetical protein